MQTTRTRRGSSFQERDSEGRFTNRSRGNGYGYENDYDDDRFGNRSSRYDEDDFERGGYGRSSRYQGDETYYDEDYPRNSGRRAYDNSAEYDDEDYDYDYDVNRYDEDEDEDYGTRGRYDRQERWGRRDFSTMNRGDYRNQPRGMHNSGWDDGYYGNVSSRRGYSARGGFNGGYERGSYSQGRGYGSDKYESGVSSRRSSGRGQGFASMPREEVRRIARMGGGATSRRRSAGSQRSTRSRSRR
jgi:hypothetical protein